MAILKEITAEHLDALSDLYVELVERRSDPDRLKQVWRQIEGDRRYIVLGAFVDGELLGSVMGIECYDLIGDCRPFMVIENVVVSARARRQGLGRQLMTAMEEKARERNCLYMILVSGERRKEAHIFYDSLGFRDEKVEGYRKHLSSH